MAKKGKQDKVEFCQGCRKPKDECKCRDLSNEAEENYREKSAQNRQAMANAQNELDAYTERLRKVELRKELDELREQRLVSNALASNPKNIHDLEEVHSDKSIVSFSFGSEIVAGYFAISEDKSLKDVAAEFDTFKQEMLENKEFMDSLSPEDREAFEKMTPEFKDANCRLHFDFPNQDMANQFIEHLNEKGFDLTPLTKKDLEKYQQAVKDREAGNGSEASVDNDNDNDCEEGGPSGPCL